MQLLIFAYPALAIGSSSFPKFELCRAESRQPEPLNGNEIRPKLPMPNAAGTALARTKNR